MMGWVWVLVGLAALVGASMLIDHRRYRWLPAPPGLTGRAKRRAIRQNRAAMARFQTPARATGYEGHRTGRLTGRSPWPVAAGR